MHWHDDASSAHACEYARTHLPRIPHSPPPNPLHTTEVHDSKVWEKCNIDVTKFLEKAEKDQGEFELAVQMSVHSDSLSNWLVCACVRACLCMFVRVPTGMYFLSLSLSLSISLYLSLRVFFARACTRAWLFV